MGIFYRDGLGVERDFKKSKEYYEKAAEFCNLEGSRENLYKKDSKQSVQLTIDGSYLSMISGYYIKGEYAVQDEKKAKKYQERMLSQLYSDAIFLVGTLYKYGIHYEKDYSKAKAFFERAHKYNNKDSYYHLVYKLFKKLIKKFTNFKFLSSSLFDDYQ